MNIKKDGKFIGVELYVGYMINAGIPTWVHLPIWIGTFKPVTMRLQGAQPPWKVFRPPLKNVLDILSKLWAPLKKIFAPRIVQSWLGAW